MNHVKKILFCIPLLLQVGGQVWMLKQAQFLPIIEIENPLLWFFYYLILLTILILSQLPYYIAGTLLFGAICGIPYVIHLYFNRRTPGRERWLWLIPIVGFGLVGQAVYYIMQIVKNDKPSDQTMA